MIACELASGVDPVLSFPSIQLQATEREQGWRLSPLAWLLALGLGLVLAAVSLSYAPGGRLNVLWLWLLWAGLPLLGSLVSLAFMLLGRDKPWLFRFGDRQLHWYPNKTQRWSMLWLLQVFWLWAGLGLLLGFGLLLLFTDLAFGWSSTLLEGGGGLVALLQAFAWPWQHLWPSAVPDLALMEATRYLRIDPQTGAVERAGDWWPFLVASILVYNLLPRSLLAAVCFWRWRRSCHAKGLAQVSSPNLDFSNGTSSLPPLREESLTDWQTATWVDWALDTGNQPVLGQAGWQEDQKALEGILAASPQRLLWRVAANRSPLAELADLMARATALGVREQGLLAATDSRTREHRHLASWHRFAQKQQLVWVTP